MRERLRALGAADAPRLALGSGDDAAIAVPEGRAVAISVDAFVDGVHFRRGIASAASIGRKAIAGALSDLAAMGADAGEVYVVLGIPPDLDQDGCMEMLEGLTAGATRFGVALAGGDVTRAPALLLSLTAVGYGEAPDRLVSRTGARPGDVVAVTGELGGAAAGLILLDRPELGSTVAADVAEGLRRRQLEPSPRLEAGRALAECGASAMIDLSDGLAGDAAHVAAASRTRLEVDAASLPLQAGVSEVAEAAGLDPIELAVGGGEDYELLACLPPEAAERAEAAVSATGSALTPIGRVTEGAELELLNAPPGARAGAGFDHLRPATRRARS